MPYLGVSLYDNFHLPLDWKQQLTVWFRRFDDLGIWYPEFNLRNILVLDGTINIVDFGLARLQSGNELNELGVFIKLIEALEKCNDIQSEYPIFVANLKSKGLYSRNLF
jgi:hypothetical protein